MDLDRLNSFIKTSVESAQEFGSKVSKGISSLLGKGSSNQKLRDTINRKFREDEENIVIQQWNIRPNGNFQENIQGGRTFTTKRAQKKYFQERINELNGLTIQNKDIFADRQTVAYLILHSKLSNEEKEALINQIKVKKEDWS